MAQNKERMFMDNLKDTYETNLSIPVIIFLHLFPGIIIVLVAFLFSSPIIGINFPLYLSLMLSIILGLIPTELLIIKYFAWKIGKKIKDIILFKEKIYKKRLPSIIITAIIAILGLVILPNIESKLWGGTFNFIPEWFRIDNLNIAEMKYLKLTLVLNLLFNGFFGPLVEEIYFRGFLLPRMKMFGKLAALINVILFSVYHFTTPWAIISRIVATTPLVYSVWANKNIKIGIIVHCSLNIFSGIASLVVLLG
jgi:membrane protease YdiL (CAAX protease family)